MRWRAAAVVVFLAMMFVLGDFRTGLPGGGLLDPDSYSRLLRVERLLTTGSWYDNSVPWDNAPYGGATLHWTRPLDVLISAGALPLSGMMPLRRAVVLAGSALPVGLGIALVLVLLWAARPFLGNRGLALLGFLAAAQPTLPQVFRWSYVDHHGLIALLAAAGLAGTVRSFTGESRRPAVIAGIAAGLALWVTVEALGWVLVVASAVALLWVVEDDLRHVRFLSDFFTAAAGTAVVAFVLERSPATWTAMEMDRLSVPWVALLVALAAAWSLVRRKTPPAASRRSRLAVCIAAFAVPGAVAALVFPKLLHGPVAGVDPRVLPLLFEGNAEFTHVSIRDFYYLASLAGAVGPAFIAAGFALLHLRAEDRRVARLSLLTLVYLAVYLPLTLFQWRWGTYVNVAATVPWALAIRSALRPGRDAGEARRALRVPFAAALLLGHFAVALVFARMSLARARQAHSRGPSASVAAPQQPGARAPVVLGRGHCTFDGLGPVLAHAAAREPGQLIVMTTMYESPRLAWQTGARIVGSPYHRNGAGILDTFTVMSGADDAAARGVLERRGVDFVVVCASGATAATLLEKSPRGLGARLLRGESPPPWLRPVSLTPPVDPRLRVFGFRAE